MPKLAADSLASDFAHVSKTSRGLAREKLRAAIVAEANRTAQDAPPPEPLAVAKCSCIAGWIKVGPRSEVIRAAETHAIGHTARGARATMSVDFALEIRKPAGASIRPIPQRSSKALNFPNR